jgi:hypothetical protein
VYDVGVDGGIQFFWVGRVHLCVAVRLKNTLEQRFQSDGNVALTEYAFSSFVMGLTIHLLCQNEGFTPCVFERSQNSMSRRSSSTSYSLRCIKCAR